MILVFNILFILVCSLFWFTVLSARETRDDNPTFQKRAGRQQTNHQNLEGQGSTSHISPHVNPATSRTQPSHTPYRLNQAGLDFSSALFRLPREGHHRKGIMNVGIIGNPNAETDSPITTIYEGKKRGTLVSTFRKEPSPPKTLHSSNRPTHSQQHPSAGRICIHVGECEVDGSRPKISHVDVQTVHAWDRYEKSMEHTSRNGFKGKQTSVITSESSPSSIRDHPVLNIQPGKDSGQFFSVFLRPNDSPSNSPPRSPLRGTSHQGTKR